MNEAELSNHLTCNNCGMLVTACGLPLFWKLTVERHGINAEKLRSSVSMSNIVGNYGIAKAMGLTPDDVTQPMMDAKVVTLCDSCAIDPDCMPVAALAMKG